jgi:hypothetical protein
MSKALTGKWQWNGVIKPMNAGDEHMLHYLWFKSGFTSNGQRFEGIRFRFDDFWRLEYDTGSGYVEAGAGYHEDDYATPDEQYRVIDFGAGSEADDDSDGTFVKWFLSNVTRYGTVAEMLVQIAENEKAVYQSGYDKALEKGGYKQGFEDGKQAEYDAFWDGIFSGESWQSKFYGSSWNDNTFFPNRDIKPTKYANHLFAQCEITDLVGRLKECGVKLDTSGITDRSDSMFNYATKITTVPYLDLRNINYNGGVLPNMFCNCRALKTIEGIHLRDDAEQDLGASYSIFEQCGALENITFYGTIGSDINFQWSTKLKAASIESIINHLSDAATGKTLTLSLTAVDNAYGWYLPDGSFAGGSNSGIWSSLEASKPNWTINLV